MAIQRMLEFANNWEYYLTREVVEPQWRVMEAGMRSARGVGDMRDRWGEFLDGVLKECLLTNRSLLRSLLGVVRTCLLFSGTVEHLFASTRLRERLHEAGVAERLKRTNLDPQEAGVGRKVSPTNSRNRHRQRSERMADLTSVCLELVEGKEYKDAVARMKSDFDAKLERLLGEMLRDGRRREYQSFLVGLGMRLDFNGFWSGTTVEGEL